MTRYTNPQDEPITDWYAGSWLPPTDGDWQPGDALVAFTDIGLHGDGTPHAQIVVYVADHGDGRTVGASAEITHDDARAIITRLQAWIRQAAAGLHPPTRER